MQEIDINYKKNLDRTYTLLDIPVGDEIINITIRPLTYKYRQWVARNQDEPGLDYQIFSDLIIRWGDKEFMDVDELSSPKNAELFDEALSTLDSFLEQRLLRRYNFILVES
ncbi:MAG: hypothetical protein F6K55_03420 [Moorea sp. SIO4A3]|nr:hypothetical protein [Moorena sp. SIO4A3]